MDRGIDCALIEAFVANQHGAVLKPQLYGHISAKNIILVECRYKHTWTCPAACIYEWCAICRLLSIACKYDALITCCQNAYTHGQVKFDLKCSYGHIAATEERTAKRGCRSCVILEILRAKICPDIHMDLLCYNAHIDSKLRFHCNKLRHNPLCDATECAMITPAISKRSYGINCTNYTTCNQDFYVTSRQVHTFKNASALNCALDHRWTADDEIFRTLRFFEHYFDTRFDDPRPADIEFTGFNFKLRIAYTHMLDKCSAKYVQAAHKWCTDRDFCFVIIDAKITKASHIGTEIVKQLARDGLVEDDQIKAVRDNRTRIHNCDHAHKLFDDKCRY